jgi:hypothetical protein
VADAGAGGQFDDGAFSAGAFVVAAGAQPVRDGPSGHADLQAGLNAGRAGHG